MKNRKYILLPMESLVDLVCFHIKCRLTVKCPELLVQLGKLPDELLVKIGNMPTVKPQLRWIHETFNPRDLRVELVTLPGRVEYVYDKTITLPLEMVAPIVFYARVFQDRDDTYYLNLQLYPKEFYRRYEFTQRDIDRGNPRIYFAIY